MYPIVPNLSFPSHPIPSRHLSYLVVLSRWSPIPVMLLSFASSAILVAAAAAAAAAAAEDETAPAHEDRVVR